MVILPVRMVGGGGQVAAMVSHACSISGQWVDTNTPHDLDHPESPSHVLPEDRGDGAVHL